MTAVLAWACKRTLLRCAMNVTPGPRRQESQTDDNIYPIYSDMPARYYGFLPETVQSPQVVWTSDIFR